jgi:hypothetical protein
VPGVLADKNVRYHLVPATASRSVGRAGYILSADHTHFLDPSKHPIPNAIPILEKDFWAPSDTLYTIDQWLCYPINFGLFSKLPLSLIETLIRNTSTNWKPGKGRATYQVDWDGLTITKEYKVAEMGLGVAIWPPRALKRWRQFFLLFAPGAKETAKATPFRESATSAKIEPIVYSIQSGQPVAGDTAIVYGEKVAMSRSIEVPRFIAIKGSRQVYPEHGIIPLVCDSDGSFLVPQADTDRHNAVFVDRYAAEPTRDPRTSAHLAIDFGTTNTAVAVALAPNSEGEVLEFSDGILAKRLTGPTLDPAHLIESRFGFFPMNVKPANPLATVLLEIDSALEPFTGLQSLPRRSIPGDTLEESLIKAWVPDRFVKQEFKWQQDDAGAKLRGAFLEMLARFVGWELRTNPVYQSLNKVQVLFTCPLSFSRTQTESLKRAQDDFRKTMEECGFEVTLRDGLVSESLANLYLVRNAQTNVGRGLPEERHVVIDIGGGSTDISVFDGIGRPLFLDSLYLGGKDLSETVLLRRLNEKGNKLKLTASLERIVGSIKVSNSLSFGQMLQLLLILRLERDMEEVANDFSATDLCGTPADFLTLLVFTAVYGVRMASCGCLVEGSEVPEATTIRVWFVGLGSRLFELSPLRRAMSDRLLSAKGVLEESCKKVIPKTTKVSFAWRDREEAKLSVCRGALLVPATESALELHTMYWATIPAATPPINWSDVYDHSRIEKITAHVRRSIITDELVACAGAAIEAVSKSLQFKASDTDIQDLKDRLNEDYSNGVGKIASNTNDAPPHPLISATNGLKLNVVGLMRA